MKKEKKKRVRNKENKKRESLISRLRRRPAHAAGSTAGDSGFDVRTVSSEPILRLAGQKKQAAWKKDLAVNCSCAVLLTAAIALFCALIGYPEYIPFALTCPVVFMAISEVSSIKPGFAKWIAASFVLIILLATAIIWHSVLYDSACTLTNYFYDVAEEAQAYLYDRLPAGGATEGACRGGIAWASALIGMLAALPPAKFRRGTCVLIAAAVMIALAYYGLVPSAICIAVIIAGLIAAVSRGNVMSTLPVLLAALLIFGAIVLVNPGENYGISRVDENLRDRFALNSALLEGGESPYDEFDEEDYDIEDEELDEEESYEEEEGGIDTYAIIGFIIAAVLAIGALAFFLLRRLFRRRAQNRKGIDSADAREAVAAMFPYTVRWLRAYGVEQTDPSFMSMVPALEEEFQYPYPDRFSAMYDVWSEAAYSDHSVSEETRWIMETFMKDTIDQINDRCKFKDKLKLKLRHAL